MASSPNAIPLSSGQSSQQEIAEKFGSLKRRYAELEQESNSGINPSDERNVRMREERDFLLQKMKELEQSTPNDLNALPPPVVDPKAQDPQEPVSREDANKAADARGTGKSPRKARGSAQANSPHSRNPRSPDLIASTVPVPANNGSASSPSLREQNGDKDIEMEDGRASGYSHSRATSGAQPRREQQERDGHTSEQTASSSRRETRATRQNRGLRSEGNVIAAVAAATAEAEAEAAATLAAAQSSGRIPSQLGSANQPLSSTQRDVRMVDKVSSPTSALAHALGVTTDGPPPKDASTSFTNLMQHAPSIESILKVAEAAVAAQNAAAAAAAASSQAAKDASNSNIDPNLDPSLFSDSSNGAASKSPNAQPLPLNKSPQVNISTTTTNNQSASSSSSTPTSSTTTPTPTSSLSSNPYLSLSTNLLPRVAGPSSASPNVLMPYPMFYSPGTPVTPNSPSYPMPYNPYYYLAAPMPPPQNGMYPPPLPPSANTNFPPTNQQQPQQSSSERPKPKPAQKAKRLKAHAVTTKSFSIPLVPRDKNKKPMLPLNVGIMTVISLGEVCMREHFHTERYIFPVGYEVTRRYLSTIDPSIEVVYHCTILDGGDGPKFQIIPSDKPDKPIIAGTATGAWSNIVKQANAIRNRQHSNSVSGPDFFGLGQNTIKHLIQELPNANRLRDYVWQNFVEGGPLGGRHAAVIPALPEEYDASMPIGAYYPKRDLADQSLPRGMSHYPQHIIAQAEAQKAQRLAAQAQEQGLAGPSGSISAPTPLQQGPIASTSSHPQLQQLATPATSTLNIREYQPNHALQAQSVSQGPEKRTKSNTAASADPSVSTSGSTRSTRAAARGNQQHQQQQQPPLPQQVPMPGTDVGSPPIGADGTMPTTFAGIMNMYPSPGIPGTNGAAPNSTIPPG